MSGAAPAANPCERLSLRLEGAVQGVGLRPFVCRTARSLGLTGHVRNGPEGVEIEAEGEPAALRQLVAALRSPPAPARIDALDEQARPPTGGAGFAIAPSRPGAAETCSLVPDLATCGECMAEVLDRESRRHRHPFASCARCGPRFSVARSLPWDRARTALADFGACARCRAEHDDPTDRRFHAQTLACPACGPRLAWLARDGRPAAREEDALQAAIETLREGRIVALKGLGGFQLLVDARDDTAVRRLRARKHRPEKPLALLVRDADEADALVELGPLERRALASAAGPIVLARRRPGAELAASVAPGLAWLGVLLPTTPLHRLLRDGVDGPLVATSGNRAGEPLCTTDEEALAALGDVADGFLTHDRAIVHPIDDSVVRQIAGRIVTLRCARGLAPLRLTPSAPVPPLAALGGDLKAAVAVGEGDRLWLGPHVGDLESPRTQDAAARGLQVLAKLAGVDAPRVVADAHPDGHARSVAAELDPGWRAVRHHPAHVLSCLAEHGLAPPVLGVAWDGGGDGGDGSVWGGELLRVDQDGARRLAWLRPLRLPGGEAAVRQPRRIALSLLFERFGPAVLERDDAPLRALGPERARALLRLLQGGRFAPLTHGAGRLFDAAAALLDVRQTCSFEGQAAMELESLAAPDPQGIGYPLPLRGEVLDWAPLLDALLADRDAGVAAGLVATRFHRGLAWGIVAAVARAARELGLARVVLTGGCFQNALLTELTHAGLVQAGLEPLLHARVPPNDGGLAAGQILAEALRIRARPARAAAVVPA